MDTSWSESAEDWQRIKWARVRAGYSSARAAAEALDMEENTYSAYERAPGASKTTRLNDHQRAIQFARRFKVSWTWLLSGEGTPFDKAATTQQKRILEAMADAPEEQQEAVANAIETLLRSASAR